MGEGIIEALVQCAEFGAVLREAKWAGTNSLDWIHSVHDVEDADCVRFACEGKAAVWTPLRGDYSGLGEILEDL